MPDPQEEIRRIDAKLEDMKVQERTAKQRLDEATEALTALGIPVEKAKEQYQQATTELGSLQEREGELVREAQKWINENPT